MKKNIANALTFILILWLIAFLDTITSYEFGQLGIVPRTMMGLRGIVFSPFVHANYYHLMSNTIPTFVLLLVLLSFYKKNTTAVIVGSVIIGGLLVWIFGRSSSHIGISGLIYSMAAFLITAGLLKKDLRSLFISILIIILYGGLIWGVLPGKYWISWEGHLFGAIAGIFMAFSLFKKK